MNTIKFICILAVMLLTVSCETENGNGTIVVNVKYKGQNFSHAIVYIKSGTLINPNISLQQYDFSNTVDTKGEVHFENLIPADYFVYVSGEDDVSKQSVSGEGSVSIRKRFRQNEYDISITLN